MRGRVDRSRSLCIDGKRPDVRRDQAGVASRPGSAAVHALKHAIEGAAVDHAGIFWIEYEVSRPGYTRAEERPACASVGGPVQSGLARGEQRLRAAGVDG